MTWCDIVLFSASLYIRVYRKICKCFIVVMEKEKQKKKNAERDKQPRKPDERFQQLPLFAAFKDVWSTGVP